MYDWIFSSLCVLCVFFLLFSGVLFDRLFYANEFHCLFKCHTPKEREKKKTAVRAGSLFLFLLFDCLPPFCLVLYHCFCYFSSFLVRYVLVENRPAQTHDVHSHSWFQSMPLMAPGVRFSWSYRREYVKLLDTLRTIWICDFFKFSKQKLFW